MLWDLVSTSSHSEVDVRVISSVRNIENGNSQLEHEKVCFTSFCLFMNSRLEYETVFSAMPLCPRKTKATDYIGYQEALLYDILLEVRGLFRPVPYLAFPLYLNSISGNGTETRDTISAGDSITYTILFKTI